MATTADKLSQRSSAIAGKEGYDTKTVRNRATIAGAAIGGMFGVYYGYTKKKNMLATGLAGLVMGAILSRLLMPKD